MSVTRRDLSGDPRLAMVDKLLDIVDELADTIKRDMRIHDARIAAIEARLSSRDTGMELLEKLSGPVADKMLSEPKNAKGKL